MAVLSYGDFEYQSDVYRNIDNNSPQESRFFLFKEAKIKVACDYENLLKYIQTSLIYMGAKAIDINYDTRAIEAYVGIANSYKVFSIQIFSQGMTNHVLSIKFVNLSDTLFDEGSQFMNKFIRFVTFNPLVLELETETVSNGAFQGTSPTQTKVVIETQEQEPSQLSLYSGS